MKSKNVIPTAEDVIRKLNEYELMLYSDLAKLNELQRREIIWEYAKSNTAIPLELLPFLAEVLNNASLGKYHTAAKHRHIVMDVLFTIYESKPRLTIEKACEIVAPNFFMTSDSVKRLYKDKSYAGLKKRFKQGVKNQEN